MDIPLPDKPTVFPVPERPMPVLINIPCPNCGSPGYEHRVFNKNWYLGDVICQRCGHKVRDYNGFEETP